MVILPVKPLGPFEHVGVLFYDMKQKYLVSDMKYFVVMDIYFFIYSVFGGKAFILCSG